MNIGDYCNAIDRKEIQVNREYQRSDKVWPDAAKSYLVESVILGYPIPKFYLHSITDAKNRSTIKEIVDGQQRSIALKSFFDDGFKLSNSLETEDLRGKNYSALSDDAKGKFLSYNLSIDQFVGANAEEVREVFRRMNSYTIPLNPEEMRHAQHQGEFKWFVGSIASKNSSFLGNIGTFTQKSLVRMQDLKLYSEVLHAMLHGVSTTNKKKIDDLYKDNDAAFPLKSDLESRVENSFRILKSMDFLKTLNLTKPYQIYSLLLAIDEWLKDRPTDKVTSLNFSEVEQGLSDLSASLELDEKEAKSSPHYNFIKASAERTNVKAQREERIRAFLKVLNASTHSE